LRVKEYSREFVESSKSLSSNLVSFCRAMLYLRATGQDAECSKITDSHSEAVSNAQYRMGVASTITQAIREPLVVFGIGLSLYLSLDQFANEIPVFLVSLVLLHRSLNSLLAIQGAWQNSLEFSASFDEYLDQQGSVAARRPRQHARPATDDFDGLDFKQVCLRNESIKSGEAKTFSVQIPRGAFVAVVGHSGSGKTTFLYATVGLIEPHQGGISVFGQDPFQWSTEFRREKLGLVTQDVFVAKGTLVGNVLAPYKPGVEFRQDQVKKVSDLIKELGFSDLAFGDEGDKLVLDGGLNLSGGQRQRLCFLREILKVPELLILDEVTSGLDRSNRDNVTIYLQRYTKHNQGVPKTVILTTHHRDVADRADLILLMENGQVVEIGHPSVLASNVQSKYNLLFNACSQEGLDR
jgi:ABC-type multidrug transport system fused ATPase/permease subunit